MRKGMTEGATGHSGTVRQGLWLLPCALVLGACSGTASGTRDASADAAAQSPAQVLPRYHWRLTGATATDGKPIEVLLTTPARPLTLDFSGHHLQVANGCNRMGAGFTAQEGALTVGRMESTLMACADRSLMDRDRAFGERLQGRLDLGLARGDGPAPFEMTLTTAAGDRMLFQGEPTAATRYGSAGETVFLEVAAQTRPCPHPLMPGHQCLQVRERRYDAQGLAVGTPGPYEHFYGEIEGYTHEPGVRNVLRLKRYRIANPPADAPDQAYVLDMVVESEQVRP